jgi:hypothetical protein
VAFVLVQVEVEEVIGAANSLHLGLLDDPLLFDLLDDAVILFVLGWLLLLWFGLGLVGFPLGLGD